MLIRPEIEAFKDLNAEPDELIQWEVVVRANPKPIIMWEKDGKPLTGDRFQTVEDRNNPNKYKLVIKDLNLDDVGTYKVIATNSEGEAVAKAKLKTQGKPCQVMCKLFMQTSLRRNSNHSIKNFSRRTSFRQQLN